MKKKDDFELNLAKLFLYLWKRLPIILLVFIVTACVANSSLRTPEVTKYIGKVTFLVPRDFSFTDTEVEYVPDSKNYTNESQKITALSGDTFCLLATAPTTCDVIASRADLSYSGEKLAKMVTASLEEKNSQVFSVQVKCSGKDEAKKIAKAFAAYLPEVIQDISPNHPIRVLNSGSVSAQTSGGSNLKKTLIYAFAAAFVAACFIALVFVVDEYTGRNRLLSFDLKRLYPDTKILSVFSSARDADAVKRLRTNLLLALPANEGCRLIGLTAAHADPEKDTLALNLAKSLAEMGDRVLLVDADLRSNQLQKITNTEPGDGLSELIRKTGSVNSAVHVLKEDSLSLSFLPAGNGASEASELLDSRKLFPVFRELQEDYDIILLDLEPVFKSIDASSVGKDLDGLLVLIRDEGCSRNQLTECMSQLDYASANVLGLVEIKKSTLLSGLLKR